MNMEHKSRRRIHIFWPLLLITVGVFLFLNNFSSRMDNTTLDALVKLWPLLLVIGGIESFINRDGFLWPTVISGLGIIFLLSNFGVLDMPVWTVFLKLWPILLVALGLNLIIGRARGIIAPILGILVGLLLLGAVYFIAIQSPISPELQTIQLPADGITNVEGEIELTTGRLILTGGAGEAYLVEGTAPKSSEEIVETEVTTEEKTTPSFRIYSSRGSYVYSTDAGKYAWNLALNSDIIVEELVLKTAAGEIYADLSQTRVIDLTTNLAAGKTTLALPAEGFLEGTLEGAVGELILCVPEGLPIRIELETAVTTLSMDENFVKVDNVVTNSDSDDPATLAIKLPVGIIAIRNYDNCDFTP